MTEALIQYIELAATHAGTWGLLLVFIFMTVESSFIPFPSEVVMIPAGFLAARAALMMGEPALDLALVIIAGALGSLAGAYINYFLFRWLGKPFLEKYGKYFFLPPPKLHRAEEIFVEYGAGATFVCRLIPAIRQLISIPAGISGMNLRTFTLYTTLGAGLWVTVLGIVGFYLGSSTATMTYADIVHQGKAMIGENLIWFLPGCVLFFIFYVYVHNRVMQSKVATVARAAVDDQPSIPNP